MRLALALLLLAPGLALLASPGLPLGLLLIWGAWWVYERSGLREDDALITAVMVAGGLGVALVFAQFAWQWISTRP